MRVCVIGIGYLALVTAVCLANIGHQVICFGKDEENIRQLNQGKCPVYESELPDLLQLAVRAGNLEFTDNLETGVKHGKVLLLAMQTPILPNGESDTRDLELVAREIGFYLDENYKVIINKSLAPVGFGEKLRMMLRKRKFVLTSPKNERTSFILETKGDIDIVVQPEFLRKGLAIYDTFNPEQFILGSNSAKAIATVKELYQPIIKGLFAEDFSTFPIPVVVTDLTSAESIQITSKSILRVS